MVEPTKPDCREGQSDKIPALWTPGTLLEACYFICSNTMKVVLMQTFKKCGPLNSCKTGASHVDTVANTQDLSASKKLYSRIWKRFDLGLQEGFKQFERHQFIQIESCIRSGGSLIESQYISDQTRSLNSEFHSQLVQINEHLKKLMKTADLGIYSLPLCPRFLFKIFIQAISGEDLDSTTHMQLIRAYSDTLRLRFGVVMDALMALLVKARAASVESRFPG